MKAHQLIPPQRRLIPRAALLSLLFLFRLASAVHAQSGGGYESKNGGFTGGTGAATNGAYRLTGVFQPSAPGAATNGGYSLTGRFASVGLVQTPGAPLLRIAGSGSGFLLSWPDLATGFKLQSTPALVPSNWSDVTQPVGVVGSDKTLTVPAAGPYQFYRLFKP